MSAKFFCVLLISLAFTPALYSAGTTGAPVLNFVPSPRVNSLGNAGVSIPGNFNTAAVNPAVLGTLDGNSASALFYNAFMDSGIGYLAFSKEVGPGSLSADMLGYFGGKITIDDSAGRHDNLHGKKLEAQRDTVFSVGYGSRLFSPELYGGIKFRYYTSTLLEEYTATAFSADAGFLVKTLFFKTGYPNLLTKPYSPGIRAGFSVRNLGEDISYTAGAEKDPLPLSLRAGLSYPLRFNAEHSCLLSADAVHQPHIDLTRGGLGFEYINRDMFFLRAGYRLNYEIKNFTWGLGIMYGGFQLDYGMGLTSAINTEHMMMFTAGF